MAAAAAQAEAAQKRNIIFVSFQPGDGAAPEAGDKAELFKIRIFSLVWAPGVFARLSEKAAESATARGYTFKRIDFFSDGYAVPTEDALIDTLVHTSGQVTAHLVPLPQAARPPRPATLRGSGDGQPAMKQSKLRFAQHTTEQAAAAKEADMLYDTQTARFTVTG